MLQRTAAQAVGDLSRRRDAFGLIWADPPFETWDEGLEALTAAVEGGIAESNTIFCLECPAEASVESRIPDFLEIQRDLKGGASRVVILRSK